MAAKGKDVISNVNGSSASSGEEQDCQKRRKFEELSQIPTPPPESFARCYQLEALEKGIRENTIVLLETGSGKTLIAIMLLRAYAYHLRKPSDLIAVFLVPKVVLVKQQADVIEMHTDLKVARYWGEMGVDFWSRENWSNELEKHEVFVMTPQILLNNLRHCFFKLEKIKLLIFDECHHASGKHPYACIMQEFYHGAFLSNAAQTPRIFGLTASIIKGSVSEQEYGKRILDFERLMVSKVFTVPSESFLAKFVPFPAAKVMFYDNVEMPQNLCLYLADLDHLRSTYLQTIKQSEYQTDTKESMKTKILKLHTTYLYCLKELGSWLALKAAESLSSLSSVVTNYIFWGQLIDSIDDKMVRDFSQDVFQALSRYVPTGWFVGEDLRADVDAGFLTAKVDCLIQALLKYRLIKDLRCIIFVERVISAMVLNTLLGNVSELACWKTSYMAGNRQGIHFQRRSEQIKIVEAFRDGKVNIIVATEILEEGLDVQSCNLVVRFDPSASVSSFIQSRGRVRKRGSDYLSLVRRGDSDTLSRLQSYLASVEIMRRESFQQASLSCTPTGSELNNEETYCVEKTGAIMTMHSSVSLLYYYCSKLPSDRYFKPTPRFDIDKTSATCTLRLPKCCSLQTISVQGCLGKLKQIACFEACKKLHKIGHLSDYLLPEIDAKQDAEEQEYGEFSYEEEQVDYFPGELVDFWSTFYRKGLYHCYSIMLKKNFDNGIPCIDLILIVNSELGIDFVNTSFQLGGLLSVNMEYLGTIHLNDAQVKMARRFQISILKILRDRHINALKDALDEIQENNVQRSVYLVLPSIHNQSTPTVDWDCVCSCIFSSSVICPGEIVMSCDVRCCSPSCVYLIKTNNCVICHCILKDSLVFTPHNGRVYHITGILDDMDGNSFINKKSGDPITYKEHFARRYGITLSGEKDKLLGGMHVFSVENLLYRQHCFHGEEPRNKVELPPELCVVIMSHNCLSTLYSFSFIPSIMHRIESILLAGVLKKIQVDTYTQICCVPTTKVLEAITMKKCQERYSLESLETLGDSFLKYAVGQHLFRCNQDDHEGILSIKKERLTSNATLCKLGCMRKLQGFIRGECFDPQKWIIPGESSEVLLAENAFSPTAEVLYIRGSRQLKSKAVADVVEALIGAYLSTSGELMAVLFLEWLGMKIDLPNGITYNMPFLEVSYKYVNISHLESLLKYKFSNPSLLVEALTHASYQHPDFPWGYQRLEFLGDCVLDYLITVHLYNKYPGLSPGFLTDLRSASVNNDCYAHAAVKAGLHKHILHLSSELNRRVTNFVENFEESFSGSSFGWVGETNPPKVLGDIMESIGGAVLVDSGFNKEAVWESIRPLLEPLVTPDTIKYQPVRELEDLCRKRLYGQPSYIWNASEASITCELQVDGILYHETKTGFDKKSSYKLVAKAMLDRLKASISGNTESTS